MNRATHPVARFEVVRSKINDMTFSAIYFINGYHFYGLAMFGEIVIRFPAGVRAAKVENGMHDTNEFARLEALKSFDILDTAPEEAFDRIVELAQVLFDAPMALLTFIDRERQWTKASVGVDVTEIPRDLAFCHHTIMQSDVLVVPDATLDPRFATNPFVVGGPKIRFYAGAPILAPEGARIGAVCIVASEPRDGLLKQDRRRLQVLAGIAANELELRRKTAQARTFTEAIEHRMRTTLLLVNRVLEAQAATLDDRTARGHLLEAVDRISGLDVVQRHLRHGAEVFAGDAHAYLLSLTGSLQDTLMDPADGRSIDVATPEPLAVSPDTLPILGMVVVELVTNAVKHGDGRIGVLARAIGDAVVISVTDEGRGFIGDVSRPVRQGRVGLRLVSMLARPDGIVIDPAFPQRITVSLPR